MANYIKICNKCNHENLPNEDFCTNCGSPIYHIPIIEKNIEEKQEESKEEIIYESQEKEEVLISENQEQEQVIIGRSILEEAQDPRKEDKLSETENLQNFRRCRVCGHKNYLLNGKDVKICERCHSDELYRSPIEREVEEIKEKSQNTEQTIENTCNEQEIKPTHLELIQMQTQSKIEIPLEGAILGRLGTISPEVFEDNPYISRQHVQIKWEQIAWTITDCSSVGTRKNGEKLEKGKPYIIKQGDIISLADMHFLIEIKDYIKGVSSN